MVLSAGGARSWAAHISGSDEHLASQDLSIGAPPPQKGAILTVSAARRPLLAASCEEDNEMGTEIFVNVRRSSTSLRGRELRPRIVHHTPNRTPYARPRLPCHGCRHFRRRKTTMDSSRSGCIFKRRLPGSRLGINGKFIVDSSIKAHNIARLPPR